MARTFIFPGQGSQFIGMGKDLAESFSDARDVFEEVDETLSQNLSRLMFEGEESDLNMTENTQPALMAVSMAVVRVLEKQGSITVADHTQYVAGHSLGEYSALCAAGVLSLSDTARLLKLRGQAMQRAVPLGQGAMAAILGLDFETVQNIANASAEGEVCQAANDNSEGQVVVSGHVEAVERAVALASEKGARKAVILPVSAPFHCSLMEPAAVEMADALCDVTFNAPSVPVIANVTAAVEQNPDRLRDLLVEQITGTVRWRESVIMMRDQGVEEMAELGAGKVLSGLIRRIDKSIKCDTVGTPEQVEKIIDALS